MAIGIVGRKVGMTRIFSENGASIPVTVIEVEPNRVTQLRTTERDGYQAIQVTTGSRKSSRITKPVAGHLAKANVEAGRGFWEFRMTAGEVEGIEVGTEIKVDIFEPGQIVDVRGNTQGKGFQGQARGPQFPGLLRYDEVDRWNPILVADHPYDLELCDLCVRQCPIEIRITQCAEKKVQASGEKVARVAEQVGNECPPVHAIALERVEMPNGELRMSPVIKEGCVGCGVCEMICPPEPPAIVIDIHKITDMT